MSFTSFQAHVTLPIHAELVRAVERQTDRIRFGAWSNNEIKFELSLSAAVDHIDAWVNVPIGDPSVTGHTAVPLARIVADEVVGCTWEPVARL